MEAIYSLEDFKAILSLMEQDAGEEINAWIDRDRLFIKGEENELMLRFSKVKSTLTIAVLSFKNKRCGNGKRLLELLNSFAKKEKYDFLAIESSLTSEMHQFCVKNNFSPEENTGIKIDGTFYGNWTLRL